MSRDPYKLKAFNMADELVVDVYRATTSLPVEERFALQSQIRRAAVSVTANLVEGCARPSQREYLHFVAIAISSASETRYLIRLAGRLGFAPTADCERICNRYGDVIRALQSLIASIESMSA